ncbi:hypothetical protein KCG48_06545 [Proteiniclasticum sp. BAD-10]|uniref:Putative nitroreductase TM1586 domain-containing protein n=1 Tax=Proteiniclasticum sediminis TaxID=2804028 RepID=A0A941HQY1_9CLOT|nr:nitroreductase family protein [Proteiniclasticum sediminis]MBR0575998.1 hypothetical protein [Proteiniclasticum sediminis]
MELYENIFKRKSTKAFQMDSLDEDSLRRVEEILKTAPNLFEGMKVTYGLLREGKEFSEKATGILGAYTRVKAPHFLILTMEPKPGFRQATGYSLAHVVLALNDLGIATCITYPGADKEVLQKYLEIPEEEVPVLFVAFGNPQNPAELYPPLDYYKRRGLSDIIIQGPVKRKYKPLFEAVRLAPSSFNTQPWRFSVDGNKVHVARVKLGFVKNKLFSSLNKIDMGIALAYLLIAIKAKNFKFNLIKEEFSHPEMEYMITVEILEEPRRP